MLYFNFSKVRYIYILDFLVRINRSLDFLNIFAFPILSIVNLIFLDHTFLLFEP